jgi:hypothetical protein
MSTTTTSIPAQPSARLDQMAQELDRLMAGVSPGRPLYAALGHALAAVQTAASEARSPREQGLAGRLRA